MDPKYLSDLADAYAAYLGRGLFTIAGRVGVHGKFFVRLKDGHGCHIGTFLKVQRWFDANWPADLEWPRHIPRPAKQKREAA
jgi:hypothetical protein